MKIIISNKAKVHMEAHKNDFTVEWEELLKKCEDESKFDGLEKSFEIFKIQFQSNVGYCNCIETEQDDEIVFAKRLGRDTYTRFVKKREPKLVNSVIFILNKNKYSTKAEYFLVTMFPGLESYKEPEDLNITSKNEINECLDFWKNNALIYDESILDVNSIKSYCPYRNLYIAVA